MAIKPAGYDGSSWQKVMDLVSPLMIHHTIYHFVAIRDRCPIYSMIGGKDRKILVTPKVNTSGMSKFADLEASKERCLVIKHCLLRIYTP